MFQQFMKTAPSRTWPRPGTQQGIYVMTPDGKYVTGKFVAVTKSVVVDIINDGWSRWSQQNKKFSHPVPTNHIRPVIGSEDDKTNLKIRVAYRDLPRGKTLRPGNSSFPNPYNIQWYDLKTSDLEAIIFQQNQDVWKRIVLKTMKDSVRGEMGCWYNNDWKSGSLQVNFHGEDGPYLHYRVSSDFNLQNSGRKISYNAKVYGDAVFDRRTKEFTEFNVLAAGTRSGAGPSNGRHTDKAPAPLAIAIRINY